MNLGLRTKADRQKYQKQMIDAAISGQGYKLTEDGKLKILQREGEGKFYLRVYEGDKTKPTASYYYSSEAQRADGLERIKKRHQEIEEYKEKRKSGGRYLSEAAKCAQAIREDLKKAFPGVKFKVTSDNYSMGDHVNVSYEDGPTSEMVEGILNKYEYGKFNGMEDIYEITNRRDDIPQTKYLFVKRYMSENTREVLKREQSERWGEVNDRGEAARIWDKCPLPVGAVVTGIKESGIDGGSIQDFYTLEYSGGKQIEPAKVEREVTAGQVQIIEHPHPTRRGKILVIGDTYKIKDKLKSLGGRWNKFEKGWEFEGDELEKVKEGLKGTPTLKDQAIEKTNDKGKLFIEQSITGTITAIYEQPDDNWFLVQADSKNWYSIPYKEKGAGPSVFGNNEHFEKYIAGIPEGYTKNENPHTPSGYLTPAQVKAYNTPEMIQARKEAAEEASAQKVINFTPEPEPEEYESLEEMEEAVKEGKVVSLLNLSNLVNAKR